MDNESLLSLPNETISDSSFDNNRMPPFSLPLMMRINRFMCITLGLPLNALVLVVIIRSRQLWSTRNIFWITVTFFNLLALVQAFMELAMYYLHQNGDPDGFLTCKIYSLIVACPYALLLTTLTLATADRYSALAHPQFYQRHVTEKRVIWTLLIIVLVLIGAHSSPYWTGYLKTDQCQLRFSLLAVTLNFHALMALICLILQIRLYLFIRNCIRYSENTARRSSKNENIDKNVDPVGPEAAASILNPPSSTHFCGRHVQNGSVPTIITSPSGQKLSWLEMRAAKILTVGILPFCLINLASSMSGVAMCFVSMNDLGSELPNWLRLLMILPRELILLHLIYIPAVFSAQSREFHSASRRFCRCCYKRKRRRNQRSAGPQVFLFA